jgi:hypothetical protein
MDELEIDGKKYLSSRRAAKEHKYHTDYIGQLIRAGKVVGKKVGRAWYVEQKSLNAYLTSEGEVVKEIVEEAVPEPEPIEVPEVKPQPEPEVEVPEITTPVIEAITEEPIIEKIEERIIPIQQPEQKIHITLAEREVPQRKSTLTYIEDNEPLMPELSGRVRTNADFIPRRKNIEAEEQPIEETQELITPEPIIIEERIRQPLRIKKAAVLAVVAIAALAVIGGISSLLATSIEVKEGQPASVILTVK